MALTHCPCGRWQASKPTPGHRSLENKRQSAPQPPCARAPYRPDCRLDNFTWNTIFLDFCGSIYPGHTDVGQHDDLPDARCWRRVERGEASSSKQRGALASLCCFPSLRGRSKRRRHSHHAGPPSPHPAQLAPMDDLRTFSPPLRRGRQRGSHLEENDLLLPGSRDIGRTPIHNKCSRPRSSVALARPMGSRSRARLLDKSTRAPAQ